MVMVRVGFWLELGFRVLGLGREGKGDRLFNY